MSGAIDPAATARLPELWEDQLRNDQRDGMRRTLAVLAGLCVVLLVLAAVVPIGGSVIGTGRIAVETQVKRIAHPTGGVIAEIAVRNGAHVAKGQLLLRLDDRVSGADATYSNLTVEQLLAQRARLEAERLGESSIRFPGELAAANTATARKAMDDERRLFVIRSSEQSGLRAQLAARVDQFHQEIAGYRAQIGSLRRQLGLIEPERRSVRELWDKQLVTISRLNQLERTAADLEGNVAALESQIASTSARITEAQEQSIQLKESRRAEAGRELGQINTALNQQQLRSVAASDQQFRSEIRAPYSGTVEKIAFAAVGDVIKPAEPIMEIVPDADALVVEAMVSPADIDQVSNRQQAIVRFTSFNVASTPVIAGRVTYVATDPFEDQQTRQAFYVVRIAVDQRDIGREALKLRSGMPAEVHIQTGSRSLLSYLFKPLGDQFARAFRDG